MRSNEDGTVSLHDLGGGPGTRTVTVVVSDGNEPTTGTLTVDVRDAGNIPPTANADFYVARSGEPLTLEPLANDTDANGDSLSLVALSVAPEGTASNVRFGCSGNSFDVTYFVAIEPIFKHIGVGLMTNGKEETINRQVVALFVGLALAFYKVRSLQAVFTIKAQCVVFV